VAKENCQRNRVKRQIRCVLATGYRHPAIRAMRPCPLILANILARPLCELAPALAHHLTRGGYTIASGLLVSQQQRVIHAYAKQGVILRQRFIDGHWATLLFEKP
jgi:ribosomal protein L11 methyltransferase